MIHVNTIIISFSADNSKVTIRFARHKYQVAEKVCMGNCHVLIVTLHLKCM